MILHWLEVSDGQTISVESKFNKQSSELLNMSHDVYKVEKKLRHLKDSLNIQTLNENEVKNYYKFFNIV